MNKVLAYMKYNLINFSMRNSRKKASKCSSMDFDIKKLNLKLPSTDSIISQEKPSSEMENLLADNIQLKEEKEEILCQIQKLLIAESSQQESLAISENKIKKKLSLVIESDPDIGAGKLKDSKCENIKKPLSFRNNILQITTTMIKLSIFTAFYVFLFIREYFKKKKT